MRITFVALTTVLLLLPMTAAAQAPATAPPALQIARMSAPPDFDDFLDMSPSPATVASMTRVDNFIQRWPSDGQPERFRTAAFLGYTADALHVVFLAFDPDPKALRAHLIRREEVFTVNDDAVELRLDTFGDRRHSYYFVANPLGVQLDAAWPEFEGQYDDSFDVVWRSHGQRTEQGFVVWMSIPFKSVRFTAEDVQTWGIYLGRWIPRTGEWNFWPHISNRQQSMLSQMARLDGVRGIEGGRGAQVIPYASSRAFKALDARAAGGPAFVRDPFNGGAGVDAKLVAGDAVIDVTANPDFSQVESDAPQITTNQRFEVFFPEKRPFFLENAGFLRTPISLLFTRRLADPSVGARLTGKFGGWTIGGLATDDQAPGLTVEPASALHGRRAWAAVGRVSRRLSTQSSVGALLTHRTFGERVNTVAAIDSRVRFRRVWSVEGQLASSRWSAGPNAASDVGSSYLLTVNRNGRTVTSATRVEGSSADFVSDLGFVPRTDYRLAAQSLTYTARPASTVNDWGPTIATERVWAHDGTPLDWRVRPSLAFNFKRATTLNMFAERSRLTLRPGDASNVAAPLTLDPDTWGISASTSPRPAWSLSTSFTFGRAVHFSPAGTRVPDTGAHRSTRVTLNLRPLTPLRVDNTWLRTSLVLDDGRAFATSIVRTRIAWQFTREWSLRVIGQYDSTQSDARLTTVRPRRNFNADVLLTRLINPWTAIYLGYNGNAQNIELVQVDGGRREIHRTAGLARDSWQVFIKWSRLFRW